MSFGDFVAARWVGARAISVWTIGGDGEGGAALAVGSVPRRPALWRSRSTCILWHSYTGMMRKM